MTFRHHRCALPVDERVRTKLQVCTSKKGSRELGSDGEVEGEMITNSTTEKSRSKSPFQGQFSYGINLVREGSLYIPPVHFNVSRHEVLLSP